MCWYSIYRKLFIYPPVSYTHLFSPSDVNSRRFLSLEEELGVTLLLRQKNRLELTSDGENLYPFIQAIYAAEKNLSGKKKEIEGLESSVVSIAAWSSVSRLYLPILMKTFQEKYPSVEFKLLQGGYEVNAAAVRAREADLGFISTDTAEDLEYDILYEDELLAVLPSDVYKRQQQR